MSGHFVRLLHVVPKLVSMHFPPVVIGAPDEFDRLVSAEVADYSLANFKSYEDASEAEQWSGSDEDTDVRRKRGPRASQRHVEFAQAWALYLEVFNGAIWKAGLKMGAHYNSTVQDLAKMRDRASFAICSLCLRAMPIRPSQGKWTRFCPAVDWWMLAMGANCVMMLLFNIAFQKLDMVQSVPRAPGSNAEDPAIQIQWHWHELFGKRGRRVRDGLSEEQLTTLIILAIVMEPCRYLARWFMKRASSIGRSRAMRKGRSPPLCDLTWARASPAVKALQYLSYVLSGRARRLMLLYGRCAGSFDEWSHANPSALMQLRRTAQCAIVWIHYRHLNGSMSSPWMLAGCVDRRRPLPSRRRVVDVSLRLPPEQVDEWFLKVLQDLGVATEAMMGPFYQDFLRNWAWEVSGAIAHVEFVHSRNKRRSDPSMNWATFASLYILGEQKLRLRWQTKAPTSWARATNHSPDVC